MKADLRAQYFTQLGFAVWSGHRGSARRGLAFESAIYSHMGSVEVRDQSTASSSSRARSPRLIPRASV